MRDERTERRRVRRGEVEVYDFNFYKKCINILLILQGVLITVYILE